MQKQDNVSSIRATTGTHQYMVQQWLMHVRFWARFSNECTICRYSGACKRMGGGVRSVRKLQAGITMLGLVVVVFFAVPIISRRDDYYYEFC